MPEPTFQKWKDQVRRWSNQEWGKELDSVERKKTEEKKDSPEKKVEWTNTSRSPPEREGSNIPCPPRPLLLLFDFLLPPRKEDEEDFFWMEGRDDDATLVSSGTSQTSISASWCFLLNGRSPSGLMVAVVWIQQGSWLVSCRLFLWSREVDQSISRSSFLLLILLQVLRCKVVPVGYLWHHFDTIEQEARTYAVRRSTLLSFVSFVHIDYKYL